jgi:hypothetical protein
MIGLRWLIVFFLMLITMPLWVTLFLVLTAYDVARILAQIVGEWLEP